MRVCVCVCVCVCEREREREREREEHYNSLIFHTIVYCSSYRSWTLGGQSIINKLSYLQEKLRS